MTEQKIQEAIERIKCMELDFDILQNAYNENPETICDEFWFKKKLQILLDYYEGGQWLSDYELDEKGLIPYDLKRGILSEDGFYNFIYDTKHLQIEK